MHVTFRPLSTWPYPETKPRRGRSTFKAGWQNTLDLIDRELRHLRATNVVIGANFREHDIRLDGMPRSGAREPEHPGIELSFDTERHGRLTYVTDCCARWEHNVRSIGLGLESLRAVDRYGITQRGEQYAGWRALPAPPGAPSPERGRELLDNVYGGDVKAALRATHPDTSGNADDEKFKDLNAYLELGQHEVTA